MNRTLNEQRAGVALADQDKIAKCFYHRRRAQSGWKPRSALSFLLMNLLLWCAIVYCPLVKAQFFQGFEAQVGIEAPMSVQLRGKFNFPQNWFGILGLGLSPRFLTNSYGSMASGLGIHGEKTSELVAASIANNFAMDVRVGYEFGGNENGFYVDFGYALSAGKGNETNMDTLEGALNEDFYGVNQSAIPRVSSTLHSLVAHLGYSHRLSNSWIMAIEGGVIKPISSSNATSFETGVTPYAQDLIDSEVDKYLSGVFQDEMIVPTLSLWMSFLF